MSVTYNEDGYPIYSGGEDFVYASEFKGKTINEMLNKENIIIDCKGATKIPTYNFYENNIISIVNTETVTSIDSYAFGLTNNSNNKGIISEEVIFDNVTTLGSSAFVNNKLIKKVSLKNFAGVLSASSFNNCTSLEEINIGKATQISTGSLGGCTSLKELTLPEQCTTISQNAFNGCTNLTKLIMLRTATLVSLSSANAFSNSGLLNGGTIYVPATMLSEYNSATGTWATFRNNGGRFAAIE